LGFDDIYKILFPENRRHCAVGCLLVLLVTNGIIYAKCRDFTGGPFFQYYLPISIMVLCGLNAWYIFYSFGAQKWANFFEHCISSLIIIALFLTSAGYMGYGHSALKEVIRHAKQPKTPVLPEPPDNLLVIIANFKPIPGDNETAKEQSELVADDLKDKIEEKIKSGVPMEFPKRHTQVIKGEDEIEKEKNAEDIGLRKGAHLVIWGDVKVKEIGGKGRLYIKPKITRAHPFGPTELEVRQPDELRVSLSEPKILEFIEGKIKETTDIIVSLIHGLAMFKQLKFEDAINIFKGIKNPDAEVCFYQGNALIFLSLSKGVIDQKAIMQEAIEQFDRALFINPMFAEASNNRGIAYAVKGEYDRAIDDFNKALEINPKHAEAYYNRGLAYAQGKDAYDRAILDFNEVLEINPRDAVAYYNRGNAYRNKGEYDRAILDINKALEINPRLAEAYNNRGGAYFMKDEYDRAIEDYNKALEINLRLAGAYNNRGMAYRDKGEYDRAILDFNEALEINPRLVEAYGNRGIAYRNKGEHDRAISDYNKILEINQRDALAYYNRAVAYYSKQEYGKACDDVHSAQGLGYQVHPVFLKDLREASGRDK
jgi:tetratricopeptide (TPR) repeat protein